MMNQEDLLKKTGTILKELQDQFDYLARNPEKLSELELELFLANSHFLTEHVQILKKVATSVQIHALPEHTDVNPKEIQTQAPVNIYDELFKPDVETPTFEFIVHDQLRETRPLPIEEPTIAPIEEIQPVKQDDIIASQDEHMISETNPIDQPLAEALPIVPAVPEDIDNFTSQQPLSYNLDEESSFISTSVQHTEDPVEDEIGPEPFLVTRDEQPEEPVQSFHLEPTEPNATIKHQPNLNEMLANKSSVVNINLSDSGKPVITDLKSAITLNEKLSFIKDLFDGYNLAYAEAIDLVNKMPDFNTADKFLQANYAVKHQWTSKAATMEHFYELLHQRFPK